MGDVPIPMQPIIISFVLSLALGTLASAQQPKKMTAQLHRAVPPQPAGVFSPKTGLISTGGRSSRMGARLVVNNGILTNYYSTPGEGQEWVDNNKLQDLSTDHTDQVNGLRYVYCSSDDNPNGAFEIINIYDESIYCAGPPSWPSADCSYGIAGLPGGVNSTLACWTVVVDLAGVECNLTSDPSGNRSMGWGQVWDNSTTGPWLADGGLGQTCSFTWFDTTVPNANAFQGCYWFGCIPHEGFHMQMFGGPVDTNRYWAEDIGGSSTLMDNGLLDVDNQVKDGNICTFTLSDPSNIGFTEMKLFFSLNAAAAPQIFRGGNVLIDPATLSHQPTGFLNQTYVIPPQGTDVYTQAACFKNGQLAGFSNALRHQSL